MRVSQVLGALLLLPTLAVVGDASCRVAVVRHRAAAVVVHHQAVVQHHVAAVVAPVVAVPAYGVSYYGGGDPQVELLKLRVEIEKLQADRLRLEFQLRPQGPQGQQAPPAAPGAPQGALPVQAGPAPKATAASCAGCHDQTTRAKGGGFALLAGGQWAPGLTGEQKLRAIARVRKGEMPPAGALAAEPLSALVNEILDHE
jgi:hypothetical protein